MILTESKVTIEVTASCSQCGDAVRRVESPDIDSLSTGNATQRASFWHESMIVAVRAICEREGWVNAEMAEGPPRAMCGVCAAERLRSSRIELRKMRSA